MSFGCFLFGEKKTPQHSIYSASQNKRFFLLLTEMNGNQFDLLRGPELLKYQERIIHNRTFITNRFLLRKSLFSSQKRKLLFARFRFLHHWFRFCGVLAGNCRKMSGFFPEMQKNRWNLAVIEKAFDITYVMPGFVPWIPICCGTHLLQPACTQGAMWKPWVNCWDILMQALHWKDTSTPISHECALRWSASLD